jgi:thioredoxin reductase (NADPH)
MSQHVYEAAVVGAGPIGLELAVALKRANIDYVHFDAKQIAYTVSWYAPQTRFFSSNERIAIAGVPLVTAEQQKATREQYLAYLRGVVEQYDLQVNTYEPVTGIARDADHFRLTTRPASGERTTLAKRLILATGGTDTPRMLNVPGEDLPHVSHYFGDPHHYFRRKLLVVGGRNSAVEAALRCHHAGAKVAFSYRRPGLVEKSIKYWLMPEFKSLTTAGRINAYFSSHIKRITPTHVELALEGGRDFTIDADFVLLLTGYLQDNTLLNVAGVALDGPSHCPRYDPETMQTNVPNLYVAGTAVGGTQEKFTVFIENCHVHVERIMRHAFNIGITASDLPLAVDAPES